MNNKLLHIAYVGGAGGHWLSNLIFCLEKNIQELPKNLLNFHDTPQVDTISFDHWVDESKNSKIFSTKYVFNMLINSYVKAIFLEDSWSNLSFIEKIESIQNQTSYKFSIEHHNEYIKTIDIDYSLLYTNPRLFLDNLFFILDEYNIKYNKNYEYGLKSIENFKLTCPNVKKYYNNKKELLWVGWCFGIIKYHKLPLNGGMNDTKNIEMAIDLISPHLDFCAEFTKPYVLFENE